MFFGGYKPRFRSPNQWLHLTEKASQNNITIVLMKITKSLKSKAGKNVKPSAKPAAKRTVVPVVAKKSTAKAAPIKARTPQAKRVVMPLPVREITTDQIASRAYFIWEQEGRPAGKESEHWFQAVQQLKASQSFTE